MPVTSQHDNKSHSCCHRTQPNAPLLSAASILRQPTHLGVGVSGKKRKKEAQEKRAGGERK